MDSLSEKQTKRCLKITNRIKELPFAREFQYIDLNQLPDYKDKIARPMYLDKVIQNLEHGKYRRIDDWKSDMKLIWKNAKEYNEGVNIAIVWFAEGLSDYTNSLLDSVAKNENDQWLYSIRHEHKKLMELLKQRPPPENLSLRLRPSIKLIPPPEND